MTELHFVVPGVPVSGNHRTAPSPTGGRYLTREAREYTRRVRSIATAAVVTTGWIIPDYVRVDLEISNINMDRDNVAKSIHDPLQGIVYVNDSRILDGAIVRKKNTGPVGVRVSVVVVRGTDYGFKKPAPPARTRAASTSLPSHVQAAIARARR